MRLTNEEGLLYRLAVAKKLMKLKVELKALRDVKIAAIRVIFFKFICPILYSFF